MLRREENDQGDSKEEMDLWSDGIPKDNGHGRLA
jgi:hypothetical protein